jgi:hypothetical protein
LIVKLAPTLADIGGAARIAVELARRDQRGEHDSRAGHRCRAPSAALGYGTAVSAGRASSGWRAGDVEGAQGTEGTDHWIGGISSADGVLQYLIAGASLVAVGTGRSGIRDCRAARA